MIVVIVGPTGVGKTKLSIALAKYYHTEIISGDSIQVYRSLDIGSAKAKSSEQEGIAHHMIDILEPDETFSVALYQKQVREAIKALNEKDKIPIIVGGTGFYIKSVLHDFDFSEAHRQEAFDLSYEAFDNESLHKQLALLDEASAQTIHPNNRKRVLQALFRARKGVKRSQQSRADIALYDYQIIGLTMPKEKLYNRINQRVDEMFHEGLVAEVKTLYDKEIRGQSIQAIGYKELYQYFDGEITLEEAKALIKKNSRNYAKRQYTYFNNQFKTTWFDVDIDDFEATIASVKTFLEKEIVDESNRPTK